MSFFNADYSSMRRRRLDQYQQAIQNILAKRTGAENNFTSKTALLGANKKRDLRGVLNNFAGRGMAFSTGYAGKNQEVETDYAHQQSAAESERNATLASAGQEEAEENSRFQYDLSDIASQQAQYEAEQQRALVAALAAIPEPPAPSSGGTPAATASKPAATLASVMRKKKSGRYF